MRKDVVPYPADVPHANRVVAFKLGGNAALPDYIYTPQELRAPPVEEINIETAAVGRKVFHRYCFACHGREARGNRIQPDIRFSDYLDNGFWDDVVMDGILSGVGMVSFADAMSPELSEAIRQYVIMEAQKPVNSSFKQDAGPVQ